MDDFREAYYWLRQNTPEVSRRGNLRDFHLIANFQDAKVMSW